MRWLAFGTYDARRHPRVAVLLEGIRATGVDLAELNAPLPLDTADRVRMLRQPWRLPALAWQLGRSWARLVAGARTVRREDPPDVVLVGYLGHLDVRLARRLFPRATIVLDHLVSAAGTGRDRGLVHAGGPKERLLGWLDHRALADADVVLVDTPEHRDALAEDVQTRTVVVPVGAESVWFTTPRPPPATDGRVRVIFFGVFTPLHGTPVIGAALGALAGDSRIGATMVGTGQDYDECRRLAEGNPHVDWRDWVDGADLPGLVAAHDVSLGIFGTTTKALDVVPTKVFQSAALGCAVVTSDTAPQRSALGDSALFVPPGDATALAASLRALADDPRLVSRRQFAAREVAREHFSAAVVSAPLLARVRDLGYPHGSPGRGGA